MSNTQDVQPGVEPPVVASTPSNSVPGGPKVTVHEQRRTRPMVSYHLEAGAPGMTPNQGDVQAHDIAHLKVNYVQLQARLTKMDQSNAQVMGLLQQLIIQGQQHREQQQQRFEGPAVKMKEEELPLDQQVIRPSGQPQAKRRIELTSRPLQERSKTLGSEKLGLDAGVESTTEVNASYPENFHKSCGLAWPHFELDRSNKWPGSTCCSSS